jgi:hypothetical protein
MSLDNLKLLMLVIVVAAFVLGVGAAGMYCLNKAVDQNGQGT